MSGSSQEFLVLIYIAPEVKCLHCHENQYLLFMGSVYFQSHTFYFSCDIVCKRPIQHGEVIILFIYLFIVVTP
jgi:hypothetical protein